MVRGRGGDYVAAGRADPERADALGVHLAAHTEERHSGFDVLDPVGRVLKPTWLAFALALEGAVEREGDEALSRQAIGIQTRGLFLDPSGGMGDDNAGPRAAGLVVRDIQLSGELEARARKRDVCPHHDVLLPRKDRAAKR
jgi:hypothetical protein